MWSHIPAWGIGEKAAGVHFFSYRLSFRKPLFHIFWSVSADKNLFHSIKTILGRSFVLGELKVRHFKTVRDERCEFGKGGTLHLRKWRCVQLNRYSAALILPCRAYN